MISRISFLFYLFFFSFVNSKSLINLFKSCNKKIVEGLIFEDKLKKANSQNKLLAAQPGHIIFTDHISDSSSFYTCQFEFASDFLKYCNNTTRLHNLHMKFSGILSYFPFNKLKICTSNFL